MDAAVHPLGRRRAGGSATGLGTNPRPALQTTTMAAGNRWGDHTLRGTTVAGKERDAACQRAHRGSLASSRRKVNNVSPVSSCRQE